VTTNPRSIVPLPERYRQNALDCVRLAGISTSAEEKAVLLSMAQAWIRLATYRADLEASGEDSGPARRDRTQLRERAPAPRSAAARPAEGVETRPRPIAG
jgi:hypothetical protein